MARESFQYTDYSDPKNRSFKVPIDGIIKGYTFKRMHAWTKKWDDPLSSIRKSFRYRQLYIENYRALKGISTYEQVSYLIYGLSSCIQMFEAIQNEMSPDEEYYDSFVWEAKVMFYSFFDFCRPKRDYDNQPKKGTFSYEVRKIQKSTNKGIDKNS